MLDRRCKYKVRHVSDFYLFRKHGQIYYAYYPNYKATKSTGRTTVRDAYKVACGLLEVVAQGKNKKLYRELEGKRNSELRNVLGYIDQNRLLTSKIVKDLQNTWISEGKSSKTCNNYIHTLKAAYTLDFPKWEALQVNNVYRGSFPIAKMYGTYNKLTTKESKLFWFCCVTGCRLNEMNMCEPITVDGRRYLQINGTKTCNAVRKVPLLPQAELVYNELIVGKHIRFHEGSGIAVRNVAEIIGVDSDYIEQNHVVFHSSRKVFKTLLEQCNVSNSYIEYIIGHSQTGNVNQLYFVGSAIDDSELYYQVVEALSKLV